MGVNVGEESDPPLILLGTDHLDLLFGGQVGSPDDWICGRRLFIHHGFRLW
jgi:hypothetical protein